ncbi:MAG: response regulator [Desulfobacterales bacterium]
MIRKVLFVDDDQEMLLALKEGLEKYGDTFSILLARDGMEAVERLRKENVSLVVTDLKMPRMDGFNLLAHIMEHAPDIPVIIITGYSTPEMKRLAREGGAVGYISKPFLIEDLAHLVIKTIRKESEGGTLHSVSSGMFLQLMEMEEKTCTVRLVEKSTERGGVLFFRNGKLLDARCGQLQGLDAAYEIFSWDQVNLSIRNDCPQVENRINSDLQPIILEAARRKDERDANEERPADTTALLDVEAVEEEPSAEAGTQRLRDLLVKKVGEHCGVEDISNDPEYDELSFKLTLLGGLFQFGSLKAGYFDRGEKTDIILLPGNPSTIISVNPKCPRDKILRVLAEHNRI